jgi:hypothetical protein
MMVLIMFPFHLMIQELNFYRNFNDQVQIATEMACFELIYVLNAESFSKGVITEGTDHIRTFESAVGRLTGEAISISDLFLSLEKDEKHVYYEVRFNYPYTTRFIFKDHVTKRVDVKLIYEIPIDK